MHPQVLASFIKCDRNSTGTSEKADPIWDAWNGGMVEWRNGGMAEWRNIRNTEWRKTLT